MTPRHPAPAQTGISGDSSHEGVGGDKPVHSLPVRIKSWNVGASHKPAAGAVIRTLLAVVWVVWMVFAVDAASWVPREPVVLHVAPNGSDAWSGGLAKPNRARTDGPLASLTGARDKVRALRASAQAPMGPVSVRVQQGVYWLRSSFVLEPIDSGAPAAPVVYEAAPRARPVFSGGRPLGGWRQEGPVWETIVPQVQSGAWHFRQMWVNGERRPRARAPNAGYYRVATLCPGPPSPNTPPVARDRFGFRPGDIAPWARLGDVNIVLMHSWETSIHPLGAVDPVSNLARLAAPLEEWWTPGYWEEAQRYYVENAIELLDQPGEWYLNRHSGVLTYWPVPGERIETAAVVAPELTELVRFAGDPDAGRYVENVILRGLSFQHSDWVLNPKGNSSTQAAVEVPAAVSANGVRRCAIEDCEVARVGTYGIWFRHGCCDSRIERNHLWDLGAGGIRLGEVHRPVTDATESTRNSIDNNHIHDGGHVYAAGVGIWVAQSSSNRVSHNDIHDLRYSGLSIGWNWDDAPNRTHHNTIEFNHVHHLLGGVLSDAGLIYCLGVSPGSVIRDNVFHDITPYEAPPFGWGIYLDATCGGYLVENNLVYRTRSGGLMYNNGGHDHVIRNNIFALGEDYSIWPFHEKRPNTFRANIVYLTQGQLLVHSGNRSLEQRIEAGECPGDWDHNIYWHTGGADALRFYKRTFAEWQALGLDPHSRIVDPLFVGASSGDFRLNPGSPALESGFRPVDTSQAGLYGSPAWAGQARHEQCKSSCGSKQGLAPRARVW